MVEPFALVRRYPVSFVPEGERHVSVNPASFALVPLRLVVGEASKDAAFELRFGGVLFISGSGSGSIHELCGFPMVAWQPGMQATLDVARGSIGRAALICERKVEA
jgi:hypothetical protein